MPCQRLTLSERRRIIKKRWPLLKRHRCGCLWSISRSATWKHLSTAHFMAFLPIASKNTSTNFVTVLIGGSGNHNCHYVYSMHASLMYPSGLLSFMHSHVTLLLYYFKWLCINLSIILIFLNKIKLINQMRSCYEDAWNNLAWMAKTVRYRAVMHKNIDQGEMAQWVSMSCLWIHEGLLLLRRLNI